MSGPPANSTDRAGRAAPLPGALACALRRALLTLLVVLTVAAGVQMMFHILVPNGLKPLEVGILGLFMLTFGWISIAFWTAVAGFALRLLGLEPLRMRRRRPRRCTGAGLRTRTALVMPICQEEPLRVFAGLEAVLRSLRETGAGAHFDTFILSDTAHEALAQREQALWQALRQRLDAGEGLRYRRRTERQGRKAGNIADFCRRWGADYEHMIVLDADSVMSGAAILALVHAMQDDPRAGIIQSPPQTVRQVTPFGRFIQFAGQLYGPMLTTGQSFWQLGEANYLGHNAIIRLAPFMAHCDLPVLPGRPPLGGEILSHDFVEAALMRRAGWHVYLLDELPGSYEEAPGNIIDYAARDRRWAQGNLQHLRLLRLPGLHALSRLNLALGALSYVAAPIWLGLLVLGSADALVRSLVPHRFFGAAPQLFPEWPIIETGTIVSLLGITILLLGTPKLAGLALALRDPQRRAGFGGARRLLASTAAEIGFSMLLAPLMMLLHAYFVLSIAAGRAVGWGVQRRDGSRRRGRRRCQG